GAVLVLLASQTAARAQWRVELSSVPLLAPGAADGPGRGLAMAWGGRRPPPGRPVACPGALRADPGGDAPLDGSKVRRTAGAAPPEGPTAVLRFVGNDEEEDDDVPVFTLVVFRRQQPAEEAIGESDETAMSTPRTAIQLEPPGPQRLFRLES